MNRVRYSIVVPVFNRPQEIEELLSTLVNQSFRDFEVLVIEDGSTIKCDTICEQFKSQIPIRYFFKSNSGPGPSRNYGFQQARGDYFVVFDSDCLIPPDYLSVVERTLLQQGLDAWGGPDRAHENFTITQQAMGYSMSSVLTTGGIRGGKKRVGWFQPRSFNMGISREVFEKTGGFQFDRYAEDIEFSIRMKRAGFKVGLIPEAFVYHKRRTTLSQFYRQVWNFGKGRALIGKKFPEEVKLTHWFPTLFSIGVVLMILLVFVDFNLFLISAACFGLYMAAIFLHALMTSRHLGVALISIPAALIQFFGYGFGFLNERVKSYLA